VKALLSGSNIAHLESGQDITDGIDIHSWTVKNDDESITYSMWDFAGQTVYYNTHQVTTQRFLNLSVVAFNNTTSLADILGLTELPVSNITSEDVPQEEQ
jgi:GTPase SAR1 family protein